MVKRLNLAHVMILQFLSLSTKLGSVLTAQSLEPALNSVCLRLSLPIPAHTLSLSLSQSINILNTFFF